MNEDPYSAPQSPTPSQPARAAGPGFFAGCGTLLKIAAVLGVLGICFCLFLITQCVEDYEPTSRQKLEHCFESEFGFPPSAQVTVIQCKIIRRGDTFGCWMRFTYDEATMKQIVAHGFVRKSDGPMSSDSGNPNAPTWWRDPRSELPRYEKPGPPGSFTGGYRRLWVDPEEKMVYSESVGVD